MGAKRGWRPQSWCHSCRGIDYVEMTVVGVSDAEAERANFPKVKTVAVLPRVDNKNYNVRTSEVSKHTEIHGISTNVKLDELTPEELKSLYHSEFPTANKRVGLRVMLKKLRGKTA